MRLRIGQTESAKRRLSNKLRPRTRSGVVLVSPLASEVMGKERRQGPLPFLIHQISEYGLGVVMISSAARLPNPTLPMVVAGVIILIAATADGSAGATHWVKRAVHRWVDLVVGIAAIVAAAALYRTVGTSSAVLTGLGGAALLGLSWRTNYAPKPVKPRREPRALSTWTRWRRAATRASSVRTPSVPSSPTPAPLPQPADSPMSAPAPSQPADRPGVPVSRGARAEQIGRKAGKYVGVGARVWKNRKG